MKTVLVGFFDVSGVGLDEMETPVTGNPREERSRLESQIRRKHGTAVSKLVGTVFERRDDSPRPKLPPTATLSQLFAYQTETVRVGTTYYEERPFVIVLRRLDGSGAVSIALRGRLLTDAEIRFGKEIHPSRTIAEIPAFVSNALGADKLRNIHITI